MLISCVWTEFARHGPPKVCVQSIFEMSSLPTRAPQTGPNMDLITSKMMLEPKIQGLGTKSGPVVNLGNEDNSLPKYDSSVG